MNVGSLIRAVVTGLRPVVGVSSHGSTGPSSLSSRVLSALDPRRLLGDLVPDVFAVPAYAGAGVFGAPVVFMSAAGGPGGSAGWTRESIESTLLDLVVEKLEVERGIVTRDSNFTEDLGADSLAVVEMSLAIEEVFKIEVPDEEANAMRTFGEAVDLLARKLGVG